MLSITEFQEYIFLMDVIAHCLLLEIFTNRGIGTAILGDFGGENFNNEQ